MVRDERINERMKGPYEEAGTQADRRKKMHRQTVRERSRRTICTLRIQSEVPEFLRMRSKYTPEKPEVHAAESTATKPRRWQADR